MVIKLAKPSEIPQSWYNSEIGFDLEIEDKISMHLIVILHRNLFLLQRIISHLALSCVIIFLYLKRRREGRCLQRLMVRRPSGSMDGLSTLRWMCRRGCQVLNWSGFPIRR